MDKTLKGLLKVIDLVSREYNRSSSTNSRIVSLYLNEHKVIFYVMTNGINVSLDEYSRMMDSYGSRLRMTIRANYIDTAEYGTFNFCDNEEMRVVNSLKGYNLIPVDLSETVRGLASRLREIDEDIRTR